MLIPNQIYAVQIYAEQPIGVDGLKAEVMRQVCQPEGAPECTCIAEVEKLNAVVAALSSRLAEAETTNAEIRRAFGAVFIRVRPFTYGSATGIRSLVLACTD
jgi:hypothetical protein